MSFLDSKYGPVALFIVGVGLMGLAFEFSSIGILAVFLLFIGGLMVCTAIFVWWFDDLASIQSDRYDLLDVGIT
jgi:hypothetical protein